MSTETTRALRAVGVALITAAVGLAVAAIWTHGPDIPIRLGSTAGLTAFIGVTALIFSIDY